mgnify:CR=1 FL=1|jgi:hypothetical protein
MQFEQLAVFKELSPYSGPLDEKNRWIKLAELMKGDDMAAIYLKYFDERKASIIKTSRLAIGIQLGQMLMELTDRAVLNYFHRNSYFKYFFGQDTFVAKIG